MTPLLIAEGWRDYELVDSGDGMKLERWGQYVIARPEPRVIWKKAKPEMWKDADAVYENDKWNFRRPVPTDWKISWEKIKFDLKPTEFKHVGVFPEQAVNWKWIDDQITNNKSQITKVLNLFAYTGGTTMAASNAGAHVTHVDASRPAMMWASENAKLSGIPKERIRWIQEDTMKFVQREIRRGTKYDGIIMDPPRFGRGPGGEVWKLEEDLPKLVNETYKLLSPTPQFFLINAYTADLSCVALGNLLSGVMDQEVEYGEIGIAESGGGRILPCGIFARWSNS